MGKNYNYMTEQSYLCRGVLLVIEYKKTIFGTWKPIDWYLKSQRLNNSIII